MIKVGKIMRRNFPFVVLALVAFLGGTANVLGHSQPSQAGPAPRADQLPFPTQLKKTVVFVRTNCVHKPTEVELAQMPPQERAK